MNEDPLNRIVSLIKSVALIIVLCLLVLIFQDLNDLWAEAAYIWETFDDYIMIIENQERKIMDLMTIISKTGIGV